MTHHRPSSALSPADRAAIIDRWQAAAVWVRRMQARITYYDTNSGRTANGIQPVVEAEALRALRDEGSGVAA